MDGAGQFLGLAISSPLNSLANNNSISTIFAYRATESRLLRPSSMRGHVERVDVPVTRGTTLLEANTIARTENRKCIFAKNLSTYLKSKDFTHKMKRV